LTKALAKIDSLDDEERLVAWYYRILRNTIADLKMRERVEATHELPEIESNSIDDREACACVNRLLDELPEHFAMALRSVEFEGASLSDAAAAQGISVTNLKQRRARARDELRQRLEQTCRTCAAHGCLDCTCAKPHDHGCAH
jgi:RNA polymerase sigma factor (sigma-70 family)